MLRTTLIAATAAIGLMGAATADGAEGPSLMTDEAMDTIVAGESGVGGDPSTDVNLITVKGTGGLPHPIYVPVGDIASKVDDGGSATEDHGQNVFDPVISGENSISFGNGPFGVLFNY